jgi:hypothetical protein
VIQAATARVETIEQCRRAVAIASVRDHRFQGRARDGKIALLERAARIVEALVAPSLRFGDGGAGRREAAEGFGKGGLDAGDSAEHE